jgi:hypothetical protein
MAKRQIPTDLANAILNAQATMPEFREIAQIVAFEYVDDANGAIQDGGVLLAISTVADDAEGDGFRLLVGLPRGTKMTGYLTNRFHGYVGEIVS